jgi:hypothetical protein
MPKVSTLQVRGGDAAARAGNAGMKDMTAGKHENVPWNPDPDSMTRIPLPPVSGVNSNFDRTINSAIE